MEGVTSPKLAFQTWTWSQTLPLRLLLLDPQSTLVGLITDPPAAAAAAAAAAATAGPLLLLLLLMLLAP